MEFTNILLLQAQPAPSGMSTMVMFSLIILVFYFFIMRPQNKKQKEQKQFESELEKGKEVVLASGIIGKVNKIEDKIVTLEVGTKTYLRVTKNAISKEMTDALATNEEASK